MKLDCTRFVLTMGLAAGELNDMRADAGRLAAQPRHRTSLSEVIAGGHLGDDESRAKGCGQTPKRGIGDARHRREKYPVGDFNIAYFQWLTR